MAQKIDDSWIELFNRFNIVETVNSYGYFDITSSDIKSASSKPEPRLMCKMDFEEKVPTIFKKNNLSILAISNGVYRIAPTSAFISIDTKIIDDVFPSDVWLPSIIETIDVGNITSESQALDAAMASGMIDSILKEDSFLTIRGRRYSCQFSFSLPNVQSKSNSSTTYDVKSVQIEVDGGYEGSSSLLLIEAKLGIANNINIRQLLYPHENYKALVNKNIGTYVMFYEPGSIFTFIPIMLDGNEYLPDYKNVRKFRLKASKKPSGAKPKPISDLPEPGHGAPFPQADDFEKVLFGYYKIGSSPGTESDIFSELPISPRQYNYYFNAIKWLGLAEKSGTGQPIYLTDLGESLLELQEIERLQCLKAIMEKSEVVQFIKHHPNDDLPQVLKQKFKLVGKSMYPRRKTTIVSWMKYFDEKIK